MDVILIAATTMDGYIAHHSREQITWTKDLQLFKEQTTGHPVIMGYNTFKSLAVELSGRDIIVIKRSDKPATVLAAIKHNKCFIIGGGKTFTLFAPHLTHVFITPHPLFFGGGIPLLPGLDRDMFLTFEALLPVDKNTGIFQFQYKVQKQV